MPENPIPLRPSRYLISWSRREDPQRRYLGNAAQRLRLRSDYQARVFDQMVEAGHAPATGLGALFITMVQPDPAGAQRVLIKKSPLVSPDDHRLGSTAGTYADVPDVAGAQRVFDQLIAAGEPLSCFGYVAKCVRQGTRRSWGPKVFDQMTAAGNPISSVDY